MVRTRYLRHLVILTPIVVIFFLVRTSHIGRFPGLDELLTFNTVLNYLNNAHVGILDGDYARSFLYTYIVSVFVQVSGIENIVSSRIVSLLFDIAMIVVCCVALLRRTGAIAAITFFMFWISWPNGIELAQTGRFYTAHSFLFFLFAGAIFYVGTQRPGLFSGTMIVAVSLFVLFVSYKLQAISIIAGTIVLIWLYFRTFILIKSDKIKSLLAIIAPVICLIGFISCYLLVDGLRGFANEMLKNFLFVPPWAASKAGYIGYYNDTLLNLYPGLWASLPVILYLSFKKDAELTIFCGIIFFVSIFIYSLAGPKGTRYIHHIMPFIFIVFALSLCFIVDMVRNTTLTGLKIANLNIDAFLKTAFMAFGAVFMVYSNNFSHAAYENIRKDEQTLREEGWLKLRERIDTWYPGVPIITDSDMHSVYFVGDFKYHYSRNAFLLSEWLTGAVGQDLVFDPRTGRETIAEASVLLDVLTCLPEVLVIAERQIIDEALDPVWFRTQLEARGTWAVESFGTKHGPKLFHLKRAETAESGAQTAQCD